jgi:flavin-dependent dehydrogenase
VIKIKIDIIGGSLSGLSAGISLKKNDKSIEVIVHEKHKKIGYNHEGRRCGEAHSIDSEWVPDVPKGKAIFNKISKAEIIIGNRTHLFEKNSSKAFILNRQEYISQLGKEAESLGVVISTNDKIKKASDLDGKYIIDASGCPSLCKRELGLNGGIKGITYQQTLENSNYFISDTIKVIYSDFGGYFWIFPRNSLKKEINLGVGSYQKYNYNLKEILEKFKEEYKIKGDINHITGGLIPIGLQRPLRYKNIIFIGDAGVGSYPLSGQGIYRALISGDLAGKFLAMNNPKKYVHMMNKIFINWDLICKTFFLPNMIFKKINPKLMLSSLNFYLDFLNLAHI